MKIWHRYLNTRDRGRKFLCCEKTTDPTMEMDHDVLLVFCRARIKETLRHEWTGISFEEFYRNAYYLVLHHSRYCPSSAMRLVDTYREVTIEHLNSQVRDELTAALRAESLPGVIDSWQEFLICLQTLCGLLMYLDRAYMGITKLGTLRSFAFRLYREQIYLCGTLAAELRDLFQKKIAEDRDGGNVDSVVLKKICEMLSELDGGEADGKLYSTIIEQSFLLKSGELFQQTIQGLLTTKEKVVYIAQIQVIIEAETARVKRCLNASTVPIFMKLMEDELVSKTLDIVFQKDEINRLVDNSCLEDLSALYLLLQRLPGGTKTLVSHVCNRLQELTISRWEDEQFLDDPVVFVKTLLELMERYLLFSQEVFGNIPDPVFKEMTSKTLTRLVASNPQASQFMFSFLDKETRKTNSQINESQIKAFLSLIVFLPNPLTFETTVIRMISKRVLGQGLLNLDFEKVLIGHLNDSISQQTFERLKRMVKDVDEAERFNAKFRQQQDKNHKVSRGFDFEVLAFNGTLWPKRGSNLLSVIWPKEIQSAFVDYQTYFSNHNRGRHVSLVPAYGCVVLLTPCLTSMNCAGSSSRNAEYSLHVSPVQACILLLFNDQEEWSLENLVVATGIGQHEMIRALTVLTSDKHKLLESRSPQSPWMPSSVVLVNKSFSHDSLRVKIHNYYYDGRLSGKKIIMDQDMTDVARIKFKTKLGQMLLA